MKESVKVLETKDIPSKERAALVGIPDTGLVGGISASYIADKLGLSEIAHLESDDFPPVVVVHEGRPKSPIRVYGNDSVMVLISEIPLTSSLISGVIPAMVSWFREKGVSMILALGGVANPKRQELEELSVYGLGTDARADEIVKKNGIRPFEEGVIIGPNGVIMRECAKNDFTCLYLMADSYYRFPDPGASASLIRTLNKVLGLDVDVKQLLEKAGEIKIAARDLMKKTSEYMSDIEKGRLKEAPVMYR
ncbi:MAG: proteasome assembly chaperone family protein [Candidatus Altiarchaeota archaeon]|nr:proteasome assembly chaperone family protein [Candidatus Altiarchaeota archaeon]